MNENLYPNLEQILAPLHPSLPMVLTEERRGNEPKQQSFKAYRQSRPARQAGRRQAIYLSRVGELTAAQEHVVTATADFLARFFDLPLFRGSDFDPSGFPTDAFREHPSRGHSQLLTGPLIGDVLSVNCPDKALIFMAVTAWDLCSNEHSSDPWGSGFGEACYGLAGVWSLRYLGDPTKSERALHGCLKRSCALATHEALHVLGLDHCADVPCLMRGSACLSGPLHLCPPCFRKLCWNRQLDLLPYLDRIRDFLELWAFAEEAEQYDSMIRLLSKKPWKKGRHARSGQQENTF